MLVNETQNGSQPNPSELRKARKKLSKKLNKPQKQNSKNSASLTQRKLNKRWKLRLDANILDVSVRCVRNLMKLALHCVQRLTRSSLTFPSWLRNQPRKIQQWLMAL